MENYEVLKQVGKGSFGTVQKIKRKEDGQILVWKEVSYGKMSERERQQLIAEVKIMKELNHPNIVRYYDRIIDSKQAKIYIVMEYCEYGDLGLKLQQLKKEKGWIKEDVIWKIFAQLLIALNQCHNRKEGRILHRDLKPANLFIDSNDNIKLGDFGLSRFMSKESVFANTNVGTPYYMSPEQIKEAKYNEKSDIWSSGCLLYQLAALRPPFEAQNHLALALKIEGGKFERLPIRYSQDLQQVIEQMLKLNPNNRPPVEELLNLPQVSLYLKERKLREVHTVVKQKEITLKNQEDNLRSRKIQLQLSEKELQDKESILQQLQEQVNQLNGQCNQINVKLVKQFNEQKFNLLNKESESSSSASKNSTFTSSNGICEAVRKDNKDNIITSLFDCNKRELDRQKHLLMFEALKKRFEESANKQNQSPPQTNQGKQFGKEVNNVRKSLNFGLKEEEEEEQLPQAPLYSYRQMDANSKQRNSILYEQQQKQQQFKQMRQNYFEEYRKNSSTLQSKSLEKISSFPSKELCIGIIDNSRNYTNSSSKKDDEVSTQFSTVIKNLNSTSSKNQGSDNQKVNHHYIFQNNTSCDGLYNQASNRQEQDSTEINKYYLHPQIPNHQLRRESSQRDQNSHVCRNTNQSIIQIKGRKRILSEERYNSQNIPKINMNNIPQLNFEIDRQNADQLQLPLDSHSIIRNSIDQKYFLPFKKEIIEPQSLRERKQLNSTLDNLKLANQNICQQESQCSTRMSLEIYKSANLKRSDSYSENQIQIPSKQMQEYAKSIKSQIKEEMKLPKQKMLPNSKVNQQQLNNLQFQQPTKKAQKPPLMNANPSNNNNINSALTQKPVISKKRSNNSLIQQPSSVPQYLQNANNALLKYQQSLKDWEKQQIPQQRGDSCCKEEQLYLEKQNEFQKRPRVKSVCENQAIQKQNLQGQGKQNVNSFYYEKAVQSKISQITRTHQ